MSRRNGAASGIAGGDELCSLDGRILPLAEARISPLDRGFLFGDAVYEVMKVASGRMLLLDRHLARLSRSLAAMRIPAPPGIDVALAELLAASRLTSGAIYLQVSRGTAPSRTHLPPPDLEPTIFALPLPIDFSPQPWALPGLTAISRADDRWQRCEVKTTALAATVLGRLAAADVAADEVVYVGADGSCREGSHTNLFVRDAAGWQTHPEGPEILAGVTRAVLLEEAQRSALPISERAPRLAERSSWREAFLCGTTTSVRGLIALDGVTVGNGEVGVETHRFAHLLAAAEAADANR